MIFIVKKADSTKKCKNQPNYENHFYKVFLQNTFILCFYGFLPFFILLVI